MQLPLNRVYGVKVKHFNRLLNVSRRTVTNDIQILKKRYPFRKKRLEMVPVQIITDHYGFEKTEIYKLLDDVRSEAIQKIINTGINPAMLALYTEIQYRNILEQWNKIRNEYNIDSELIRECDLIHFGIEDKLKTIVEALSYRLNCASKYEKPLNCASCNKHEHYCPAHTPFDVFLTPQNNEKIYNQWHMNNINIQLAMNF